VDIQEENCWEKKRAWALYRYAMHRIRGSRAVYLYAEKGLGKSTFLEQFEEELNKNQKVQEVKKNVKRLKYNYGEYKEFLNDFEPSEIEPPFALLVDDFDRFFLRLVEEESGEFVNYLEKMDKIKVFFRKEKGTCIIATGRLKPENLLMNIKTLAREKKIDGFFKNEEYYSFFFTDWEFERLFPWHSNWREYFKEAVLPQYYNIKNEAFGSWESVLDVWGDVISDLTGGHPTLLGICKHELDNLIEMHKKVTDDTGAGSFDSVQYESKLIKHPVDKNLLEKYLEDALVNKGLNLFKRVLEHLKELDDVNYQQAIQDLTHMVSDPEYQPDNIICRGILLHNGLICNNPETGNYQLISKVLRDKLKSDLKINSGPTNEIRLKQAKDNENEGELIFSSVSGKKVIRFRDSQWQILYCLYSNKGKSISLEELKKVITSDNLSTIRSWIARIHSTLKAGDIPNPIKSRRGEGYIWEK